MENFRLPRRLSTYRHLLHAQYTRDGNRLLCDLIGLSRALVEEATVYDNWNGGTHGHDVQLFLPIEELSKIDINHINPVAERICKDLNTLCANVNGEFFANVHLEVHDENEEECQRARPIYGGVKRDPDSLSIWKSGMIRLFISHRDKWKAEANELAQALEAYGISCFVAHDSIEPMSIWQAEIIKGLETMEVVLAFVTDDFHESIWTNQEIGFALGKDIPIVAVKLQTKDPEGFIGNQQALKCNLDNLTAAAPQIYKLLSEKVYDGQRLQASLVRAFVNSPDFCETKSRFNRMKEVVQELTDSEIKEIVNGFRDNDQLHNAIYLTNEYRRLEKFLCDATGKDFSVEEKSISETSSSDIDDIPF